MGHITGSFRSGQQQWAKKNIIEDTKIYHSCIFLTNELRTVVKMNSPMLTICTLAKILI